MIIQAYTARETFLILWISSCIEPGNILTTVFLLLQVNWWNCRCGGMTVIILKISFLMFFPKKSVCIVPASVNASGTVTHFTIHSHRVQPLACRNHSTLPKRTTFYYYKGDKNDVLYIISHHWKPSPMKYPSVSTSLSKDRLKREEIELLIGGLSPLFYLWVQNIHMKKHVKQITQKSDWKQI